MVFLGVWTLRAFHGADTTCIIDLHSNSKLMKLEGPRKAIY
jgi:hypothetical protein